jgi:hypothetical protein
MLLLLLQVTTEDERVKFTEQLSEAEDWLYGDGEAADSAEFTAKLKGLEAVGAPIAHRASEAELRPEVRVASGRGWLPRDRVCVLQWVCVFGLERWLWGTAEGEFEAEGPGGCGVTHCTQGKRGRAQA